MARFIRRVAEPFTVFGIGALLNLILSAAAYAGVIGADRIDPDWIFLPGAFDGGSAFLVIGSSPNTADFGSAVSARHYFDLFYDFALTNGQLLDVYRWCAAELAKDGVAF